MSWYTSYLLQCSTWQEFGWSSELLWWNSLLHPQFCCTSMFLNVFTIIIYMMLTSKCKVARVWLLFKASAMKWAPLSSIALFCDSYQCYIIIWYRTYFQVQIGKALIDLQRFCDELGSFYSNSVFLQYLSALYYHRVRYTYFNIQRGKDLVDFQSFCNELGSYISNIVGLEYLSVLYDHIHDTYSKIQSGEGLVDFQSFCNGIGSVIFNRVALESLSIVKRT